MDGDNSEIRKRNIDNDSTREDQNSDGASSEPTPVSKPSDETPEFMKEALKDLSPRWRNWWIRGWFSILMIALFVLLIYFGPFAILVTVIICQVKCFHEIISIGYQVYKSYDLPWFRTISWYFLLCSNYFFYGETLAEYFSAFIQSENYMIFLVKYHRMISLMLYLFGLIMFVLSLKKKNYRLQFFMFGWTHVTLLILVTQSLLGMQNMMQGIIWLIMPLSMVICNDIMAYICGFFFGRTPLIKLSPKKTWEGFIGGAFFTVILGWFMSGYLSRFSYLTCPCEISSNFRVNLECEPPASFVLTEYSIPLFIRVFLKLVMLDQATILIYPFQLHVLSISVFASSIAPFGGFFASGFKRAFKIKDFGDTIPGHGGLMDRFDCQYLMATFVNVYLSSFIKSPTPKKIFTSIMAMSIVDQIALFESLKEHLITQGYIEL